MHGAPELPDGFSNFPYAMPDAPKGGRIVLGASGSFDNLNPMIVRGEPVQGIREFVVEPLMARSQDEPFTLYGLLAETIDVPADRGEVTFRLNPAARFVLAERGDREMPLILGLMPVLPKHGFSAETFDQTTLTPFVGSGPYRISRVDAGRSITYQRNPDYWGRDLPVNRGRFNFDEIRFDYFREEATLFEAFKTGAIDLRNEDNPARWAQSYTFPAVRSGDVIRADIPIGLPAGMTALVFNTRKPVFSDPRVREALILLFNFEWINSNLYHGLYSRTQSFLRVPPCRPTACLPMPMNASCSSPGRTACCPPSWTGRSSFRRAIFPGTAAPTRARPSTC
jgi:peptide/nickel transport system substrate-binding protein